MHDSYATMDSPIPGERQVFSRPSEQDTPSSFVQGSFSSNGLPPLPEFPAYNGIASAMQAGMSNPLFGEESAADSVDDLQQENAALSHSFGQPYITQPQREYADEQYGSETSYSQQAPASLSAGQEEGHDDASHPEQDAAEPFAAQQFAEEQDYTEGQNPTALRPLDSHAESQYCEPVPSMLMVPAHHSANAPPSHTHTHRQSSFESPTQTGSVVSEQPGSRARSARSTAELLCPSPTTSGLADSIHSFAPSNDFSPAYPPASHNQAGTVYQTSRPQSASSVSHPSASGRSSGHVVQHMLPESPHSMYHQEDDQQPAAAALHASSRAGYTYHEEDYRDQVARPVSRPVSARSRQMHNRGHPPRPHSPAPGTSSGLTPQHCLVSLAPHCCHVRQVMHSPHCSAAHLLDMCARLVQQADANNLVQG